MISQTIELFPVICTGSQNRPEQRKDNKTLMREYGTTQNHWPSEKHKKTL